MITRLKYFHGTGYQPGSNRPRDLMVAVSVGSSQVTEEILRSFESEKIEDLAGTYGDRNAGSPIEVDRLEVETTKTNVVVTIFNRGIALLFTDNERIRRLHRFFGVIERELARAS